MSSVTPAPRRWAALILSNSYPVHDRAGRRDRERRAAVDPGRPRLLGEDLQWVIERLRAHVRRLPPARRPGGRPARAPPRSSWSASPSSRSPRWLGGLARSDALADRCARRCRASARRIIAPAALSILTTTFAEGAERNKALGIWGAVAGLGGAAGRARSAASSPTRSGWEWIFFVNVPVGIAVLALAPRLLRESRSRPTQRASTCAGAVTVDRGPRAAGLRHRRRRREHGWAQRPHARAASPPSAALLVAFVVDRAARARRRSCRCASSGYRTVAGANVVGLAPRRVDVLDVLLPVALHAAGARLLARCARASATCRRRSRSSSPRPSRRRS